MGVEADRETILPPANLARAEIGELRRRLLPVYMFGLLVAWSLWVIALAWRYRGVWQTDAASLVAGVFTVSAFLLRDRAYDVACWLFTLGLAVALAFVVSAWPLGLTLAFGTVLLVIAYSLQGLWSATVAGGFTLAVGVVAMHLAGGARGLGELPAVIALYLLVWAATTVASQPLRSSIEIALRGWTQTRQALNDARQRRGELNRALRALEEATYRIERMNNELMLAREAAETARAHKAHFAAVVSHELRGPLNLILGFARLVALSPESYGVALPSAYRADADSIFENSQHLVALLDDILDLSQVEVDKLPLTRELVDLGKDVVSEVIATVGPLATRRNLYLRLEGDADLPLIYGDRGRLRQVFLNLLTNAVRFTERGGITVRLGYGGEGLLASITDTGRGIPPEQMPRLFEEFQQLHMAEGLEWKGTGLGLAISKHIVELHGGHIWAESKLGAGTTFFLTLPAPSQRLAPANQPAKPGFGRARDHDTCLVVHDDPSAVRLLARHIGEYHVVGLPDANGLLALAQELQPRAILTTPELRPAVLACLTEAALDVPVLSCDVPRLMPAEGVAPLTYLTKPLTPDMVHAVMRRIARDGETTVLLVDDEPDAVRLVASMLRSLPRPYRIRQAYNGAQALEVMREDVPDIVFMDLLMPEMDGEETIAHMRADPRLRAVPVVIVSARDAERGAVTLGDTIGLQFTRPIDVGHGAKYLRALLDVVRPSYLPPADAPRSLAATAPEQSVS